MPSLNILFCYYLMYRALADSECLGGLTHGGIVFDDVRCYAHRTFFDIIFQR